MNRTVGLRHRRAEAAHTPETPSVDGAPAGAEYATGRIRWYVNGLVGSVALLVLSSALHDILVPHGQTEVPPDKRDWVVAIVFTLVGERIVSRQVRNPIGWLFLLVGVSGAVVVFSGTYASSHRLFAWLRQWTPWLSYGPLPLLLLLFPSGQLLSRRWRIVARLAVAGTVLPALTLAVAAIWHPYDLLTAADTLTRPLRILLLVSAAGLLCWAVSATAAAVSLLVRWHRADGEERFQLKWFLAASVLAVIAAGAEFFFGWQGVGLIGAVAVPVATGVAIVKYRLYDIDSIINRSLVYAALTAAVIGLYVGTVTLLGELFERQGMPIALAATGVVAVAFQPLRYWLQRWVNRLLYGDRDQPYMVLSRLGRRLEAALPAEDVLPSVVTTITQALKLPYAAIELRHGDGYEPSARTGRLLGEPLQLPLIHQGQVIGRLVLGPRAPGEPFSQSDYRLLADIARQAGVAAQAVRLTAELQHSRERLVTAREEERRRLRRDLHDGLGPLLAGVVLQLGAAKSLLTRDPGAVSRLLDTLRAETQDAIGGIRRIAYDLRPPALDELGLVGALREQAAHFTNHAGDHPLTESLTVTVDAPQSLPALPAAVEVAGFRIATEALANVARHAGARTCRVRLTVGDEALEVEIRDDGQGLPQPLHAGVGITSMRERAAELGGTLTVESAFDGGACVRSRLPIAEQ